MPEVFANDVTGTVTSGGTGAPSAGTSETWTVNFTVAAPAANWSTSGTWFYLADTSPSAETEKVMVTSCAGGTGSMSVTVTRGADGTAPVTHTGGFTVQQVVTRATLTGVRARAASVLDPAFAGGADPTFGNDSTAAIQSALLSFGTLGGWSQGQGGVVYVPPGQYKISKPVVIPSGVTLEGSGWGSQLTLATGSNCDMIQTATYNSSSQATVLGVSAAGIANAFWSGVRDLCLHGDSFHTTTPGYCHGINVTTNPLTSSAGADPDFDPMFTVENVRIEACTGDAYHHAGRSGAFLKRVWAAYCGGIGFVPSFDTTMIDCLSEGNLAGAYFNHGSNTGAGCKFYNNTDMTWVSGTSYSPGNVVVSSGLMYFCILAVSGTTAPASDSTHWTQLTTATAPQANGYDWYWDTGCAAHNWAAVESQEPSKGSFYFKGPNAGSIMVTGQSSDVNFNNGQAAYNAANPNHYAAVTLDGVSNVHVNLNSSTQGVGAGIICTSLNSPGTNTLIATTDGTESAAFNGGTPTYALVNGSVDSPMTFNQGTSTTPALTASNPTVASFIPAVHAFAPNAATGDAVIFRVGAGLFGNSAEFAFVQNSPRAFYLGFNGGPQTLVYDDTGKVWTGSYSVTRSVLDDGSGNTALKGGLATSLRTITASATLTATDSVVLLNAATLTATLPSASGIAGRAYTVKLVAASTTGTVATTSAQTIDGAATYSLSAAHKYVAVVSDGSNWQIVANN